MNKMGYKKGLKMSLMKKVSRFVLFLIIPSVLMMGCNKKPLELSGQKGAQKTKNFIDTGVAKGQALEVYKSPTCGCCSEWVDHMRAAGITVNAHNVNDLVSVKRTHGIARPYQSCHTAVSPEGYVFEGHVPAKLVARFLAEKPVGARGLLVPAMPVGSPGMEMGSKFMPYNVLLLKVDGSTEIYEHVSQAAEQY